MPTNDSPPDFSSDEPPQVEVWLDVGEALRLGGRVLRVLDTDGEEAMLRVEPSVSELDDETHWSELPR